MKGFLSTRHADAGASIPLEARAEIYRDPNEKQRIAVETPETTSYLDISDVTVSRKKDGKPPVVLKVEAESIEVHNKGNSNGLVVITEGDDRELEEGFSTRVRRDAVITLGYQTELRLTVEREAREEYVIEGDVESDGDVVMGDQRNVDQRTSVEDVVAKDLDVSGETPAEIRDAVANDIDVGGTGDSDQGDTASRCKEHGITYRGPICPECASDHEFAGDGDRQTIYCPFCGDTIPAVANVCPACGEELPEY